LCPLLTSGVMARKDQPICSITFNQMSIPVYYLEQGKKALDGIFMIGETIREEQPVGKRVGTKRKAIKRKGSRAENTKTRREQVAKLFDKGLNKSQIMKETGASFITIAKDLEALGKGKKTRAKAEVKPKRQVGRKRGKRAPKGQKTKSQKSAAGQEKEQKKEGE